MHHFIIPRMLANCGLAHLPSQSWVLFSCLVFACTSKQPSQEIPTSTRPSTPQQATFFEHEGTGQLEYLGADVTPKLPIKGQTVQVKHYFQIKAPFLKPPKFQVKLKTLENQTFEAKSEISPDLLKKENLNKIFHLSQSIAFTPDKDLSVQQLQVGVADTILEAVPGQNDGKNHLILTQWKKSPQIDKSKPPHPLPTLNVVFTQKPMVIDGVFDEPIWSKAQSIELSDSLGRPITTRFKTKVRFAYDNQHLYVAFHAKDQDITDMYKNRDDPIYNHEALEVFLMPNRSIPQTGPYIELQASPAQAIFDASFTGPRQGMNKGFNAVMQVANKINGTLNNPSADVEWTSEWKVAFSSIPGVTSAPKTGEVWRLNVFRIEKFQENGRQLGEYTAWSPPLVGDFHKVQRFGEMRFTSIDTKKAP